MPCWELGEFIRRKQKPQQGSSQLGSVSATEWVKNQVLSTSWALSLWKYKGCAATNSATAHRFPLQTTYPMHSIPLIFKQQRHPFWPLDIWLCLPFPAGGAGCCIGAVVSAAPAAQQQQGGQPDWSQTEALPKSKVRNTLWATSLCSIHYFVTWCVQSAFKSFQRCDF